MEPIEPAGAVALLEWVGDSRERLSEFPDQVRRELGYALFNIQRGFRPELQTRRMESVGRSVFELKTADESNWYRVLYVTRIRGRIYVLHCFEKHSRKTDKRDLSIARARLAELRRGIAGD